MDYMALYPRRQASGILRFFYITTITTLTWSHHFDKHSVDQTLIIQLSVPVFKPHVMKTCYGSHFNILIGVTMKLQPPRPSPQCSVCKKKSKAIAVTGHGGPYGCETSRLPHFLDNQLTDGSETVSLIHQPAALYPQEDSWNSFLLEAELTPGP
jgi:hypothetical protein